jgi:hypothetical protein
MNSAHLRRSEHALPLVALVCTVPLLGEALMSALDFAEVRSFSASGGDVSGLLQWLRPDAVVVDHEDSAESAATYAAVDNLPLVHVCVRNRTMRTFRNGAWEAVASPEGPTPEAIRNIIAGALFARVTEPVQ